MQVREAVHGDRMERGLALIAPGGRHMSMRKAGDDYFVMVADGPPVNRHKPSVNVLFRSVAACAGSDTLAIILTGMGDDGALGMERIHEAGGRTIAQDEASCVVFGMPKEAIQLGIVDDVLPLERITQAILRFDALG
jgi:two-component system chemotaxis response regulator CheB